MKTKMVFGTAFSLLFIITLAVVARRLIFGSDSQHNGQFTGYPYGKAYLNSFKDRSDKTKNEGVH